MAIDITRSGFHRLMQGDTLVSQHADLKEAYQRASELPPGEYRLVVADERIVVTGEVCEPPPPPPPVPVDCAGAWGAWTRIAGSEGPCVNGSRTYQESRTFTVTTQPANGGTACPVSPETRTVSEPCAVVPPPTPGVPPSVYPLELVSPRAAGSVPSADAGTIAMPSGHRAFKAHPGVPYEIRPVVIGGAYPFTFTLTNAPAGMTINARTGTIAWPNPGASATPTLTVRDSEGTERTATWPITVSPAGFLFYDVVNGNDANPGTLASPRRTLLHCRANSAGQIVYFRAGTYRLADLPFVGYGTGHERTSWGPGRGSSVQLLAYPGERAIWDHGYQTGGRPGLMVEIEPGPWSASAQPIYCDGIEFTNVSNCLIRLQVEGHYHTFRRCTFSDIWTPTDGDNPAGIMHVTTGSPRQYCAYQENTGTRLHHGVSAGMYKFYAVRKMLIEDDHAFHVGGPFDLKFACPRFEVRGGWYHDNAYVDQGIVGNQNGFAGAQCSGEVRFNRITGRGFAGGPNEANVINLNNFALTERVDVYRNTLEGRIRIQPGAADTGGPFRFYNNVILNAAPGFVTLDNPANTGLVDLGSGARGNVTAAVDADLTLLGADRAAYLGTHGHEIV